MTHDQTTPAPVEVTQADREAASKLVGLPENPADVDNDPAVQAFARYRIAHSAPAPLADHVVSMARTLCDDYDARELAEKHDADSYDDSDDHIQEYWQALARAALTHSAPAGEADTAAEVETMRQMREIAREMGYSDVLDALEALSDLRAPAGEVEPVLRWEEDLDDNYHMRLADRKVGVVWEQKKGWYAVVLSKTIGVFATITEARTAAEQAVRDWLARAGLYTHPTLPQRIEAANDPDRALLMEAFAAVFPTPLSGHNDSEWGKRYVAFTALLDAGAYLDAALTLVPSGASWSLARSFTGSCLARVVDIDLGSASKFDAQATAATPALALCAAALKAHIERNEG